MELFNFLNPIELIAVLTGITGVWLAKKENAWLYPIGIVSVVLWIYLCWIGKLYGQSLINFFFFIMNIYGWFNWLRKNDENQPDVTIKFNSRKQNFIVFAVTIILTLLIYMVLKTVQDENAILLFILIESIITALNFVAMWLMAWKRIEHWILWIIGDILCIPLFIHKDYNLGVVQFLIYILISTLGYMEWKKKVLAKS